MAQRWLHWLAGGILAFTWILVAQNYGKLPAQVPIHFNAQGAPDNWGPKFTIWVLPVLSTVQFLFFTLLYKFAHKIPRKRGTTDEDAARSVVAVRSLFAQLRLAIVLVMLLGIIDSLRAAVDSRYSDTRLVPFILFIMMAPVVVFVLKMSRRRKFQKN